MAISASGTLVPLCDRPCSDSARKEPISLLLEDADRSATSELGGSRPRYTFEGCPTHRNAYVASRSTRACSRVGCPRAKTHVKEGIPLCDEHLRPTVTWHDESTSYRQLLLPDPVVLRPPVRYYYHTHTYSADTYTHTYSADIYRDGRYPLRRWTANLCTCESGYPLQFGILVFWFLSSLVYL